MPEYTGFLARYRRYIDTVVEHQVLPDGWHVERSPEVQLRALRELAEMRAMMQAVQHALPHSVALALDKMSRCCAPCAMVTGGLHCSMAAMNAVRPGGDGALPGHAHAGGGQQHARWRVCACAGRALAAACGCGGAGSSRP